MSFGERWQEIRNGFERSFWVANFTELFERLAYYGLQAVLAIYLHERLGLSEAETGSIQGIFGFVVWFLPILGGAIADRFGFRRTLATAYGILAAGYFLFASIGGDWLAPAGAALPLYWVVLVILIVPALGPGLVKPVVAGTTARASRENVRSLGFSIYYTIVNVGGMLGPLVASFVRTSLGPEAVFIMSGSFSLAMLLVTIFAFKEPTRPPGTEVTSIRETLRNMVVVLGNLRFVAFLLIFSGFFVMFWQIYIALPLYVRGYVDPNAPIDALIAIEGFGVISTTVLIAWLTKKWRPLPAMAVGVAITAVAWLILLLGNGSLFIAATLFVIALGEALQASRFYEYCSRLAPKGQEGVFMGYAFLPIAIGFLIAGQIGGRLVRYFGDVRHEPAQLWIVVCAIGLATALALVIYDRVVMREPAQST
ncbi:MAG TPA: MFS transporter [Steroidobacteraceae bacterium]|nr:MFS transporter [Steroidobacteraceae bacterium]